jgi:hypothetical protein
LIIAAPTSTAARMTVGRRVSADTTRPSRASVDQRQHTPQLLRLGHGGGAGPRRRAADVDHIGTIGGHLRVRSASAWSKFTPPSENESG